MPLTLLVNPSSAGGKTLKLLPRVEAALDARRAVFRVERTSSLEHGVEQALRAVEAGEVPVVISGDGLIGASAARWPAPRRRSGSIPGGRGNDLARVLGIPDDPEAAVDVVLAGHSRRIDVGEANGKRFLGIVSVGFDSECQPPRQRDPLPARQPRLRLRGAPHPARLEAGPLHDRASATSATGSPATRSPSPTTAPTAAACTSPPTPSSTTASSTSSRSARSASCASWVTCRRCSRAPTSSKDEVRVFRAPHLELERQPPFPVYADGEHLTDLPASLRVLPRALSVLVPAAGRGLSAAAPERARRRSSAPRSRSRGRSAPPAGPAAAAAARRCRAGCCCGSSRRRSPASAPASTRGTTIVSATNGKTTTAGMIAADPRRRRPPPGPQPRRLEHDLGRRDGAARAARRARACSRSTRPGCRGSPSSSSPR